MYRIKSWDLITENGKKMQRGWQKIADENQIQIQISGIPSLSTYVIEHPEALKFKTLITQEMLKKGFLASTNFYASIAQQEEHFLAYFSALNDVYRVIRKCMDLDLNIDTLLEGPICHSGFKRLN
jgi:hypothetical protein